MPEEVKCSSLGTELAFHEVGPCMSHHASPAPIATLTVKNQAQEKSGYLANLSENTACCRADNWAAFVSP